MERTALIGIDTNLLVRFITDDQEIQVEQVQSFLNERTVRNPGYVSLLVICEVAWTLFKVYRLSRSDVATSIETILNMPALEVENADLILQALDDYRSTRADFGDCCIAALASAAGCEYTVTFDRNASKLPGMRLLGSSKT